MYKYLMERLEEARLEPRIEKLVFIPAEALRGEDASDAFNDFLDEDTETILETLNWENTDKTRQKVDRYIEEKNLALLMTRNQCAGFLANVLFYEPRCFSFNENGKPCGWSYGCTSYVRWIYAGSIGELIEKIIKKDDQLFCNAVKKVKEEEKK